MKIAFLSEMGFEGKIQATHPNMRTEFAWIHSLFADHYNIRDFIKVRDYDHVLIIFPKGMVNLNAFALKISDAHNHVADILEVDIVSMLRIHNRKIHFVQEGPSNLWNDYEIAHQILFYNMVSSCDSILAHNASDVNYYRGLFTNKVVNVIPTLMIETLLKDIVPIKQDKTIIGGNFARWYGGFESYMVAENFGNSIWVQDSHAKRDQESMMENLNHLPRMQWIDWMKTLSTFKYAVHLMPTVAAGTFSLNCAYFGIPCIGNVNVDTQRLCHPDLSIDISDVKNANALALSLKNNPDFYNECSEIAKQNYKTYYSIDVWKKTMKEVLNEK
jgi:hypothetical protein